MRLLRTARGLVVLALVVACAPSAASSRPPADAPGSGAPGSPETVDGVGRLEVVGHLATTRAVHTATLLPDGRVLLAGGCVRDSCEGVTATTELLDPSTGAVVPGPDMLQARVGHGAVALPDGRALIVGGWGPSSVVASSELFDPATSTFVAGPDLPAPVADPFLALLADGSVLVAGGYDGEGSTAMSLRLDAALTAFTPTAELSVPRSRHAGTLLLDGRVLLVGGTGAADGTILATAEVFDPVTGAWSAAGEMAVPRHKLAVVTLLDGRVLVIGGSDHRDGGGRYRSAELFDPATSTFAPTGEMASTRYKLAGSVAVLEDGRVLVAAGAPTAEIFNPATDSFARIGAGAGVSADYSFAPAVALADGSGIVSGGYDFAVDLTDQVLRFSP